MRLKVVHPARQALVLIAIAGIAVGCTSRKVAECNQLSATINKIRPTAEKFQQEGKNFEAEAKAAATRNDLAAVKTAAANSANSFNVLVGQFEGLIKEIQGLKLEDETLVGLKSRYVQNATAINTSLKNISNAFVVISQSENSPSGLKQLNNAEQRLTQTASTMNKLFQEEYRLVSDFNNYCETRQQ